MALEFETGAEVGTPASVFSAISGSPEFVTSFPASCEKCMLIDAVNEFGRQDLAANGIKVLHNRVRVTTFAGADFVQCMRFQNAGDSQSVEVSIGNDGDRRFFLSYGFGGTILDTFPALSPDTYYQVELLVNSTANPWTVSWRVDQVDQGTFNPAVAAVDWAKVVLGNPSGDGWVMRMDDMAVFSGSAGDYPPGDLHVDCDGIAVAWLRA